MSNKNAIIRELRNQVEQLKGQRPSGATPLIPDRGALSTPAPSPIGVELVNSLTSLATSAANQSHLTSLSPILANNVYYPVTLNYMALMYMYKTHGILQTAIDMPVLDAFRGGLDFTSRELDLTDLEDFSDWLQEKGVIQVFADTVIWKRLFGGSALIVNSASDPSRVLNLSTVKADQLEFYDACRWELMAPSMNSPRYNFYGKDLDRSRVFVMSGKRAPYIIRNQLSGWGMSEIERMVADFNLYLETKNVLYEILDEAKLDIYKLDGYANSLATADGTTLVNQRIQATNMLKNFHNALILDKEDDYEQKQLSFSGLAEIMKENRIGLASALRMPITKIFGLSATGFNSGEDDIENYNAMVESEVREPALPDLRRVLKICIRAFFGDDYDFDFKFKPLRMMSSEEEERIKSSKTTRTLTLYDHMLLSSREVGEICHKENLVALDTAMLRGELEDHPQMMLGGLGADGSAGGDADGAGGDSGEGVWHTSPTGKMRRKLKSGRYEYRAPGTKPAKVSTESGGGSGVAGGRNLARPSGAAQQGSDGGEGNKKEKTK